ncbi:hypothetical protein EDC01DRAFT_628907 [Geopyxis carbonaria]|nr:hypothetical protein EDC01DRAFT_628907 [Geopyxis carbonaria]
MDPNTHFKLSNGTYEELLHSDNYHHWSSVVQYQMTCTGLWGWVTGDRVIPPQPDNDSFSDRMIWVNMCDGYEKLRLEAGHYILKCCTSYIIECYVEPIPASDPAAIWKALKDALAGTNESRSDALIRTFQGLTKPKEMRMREFSHRLHNLQKQTTTSTEVADGSVTIHVAISDSAIKEKIFENANPDHASITRHCQVDSRLSLKEILDMYTNAEKADRALLQKAPAIGPEPSQDSAAAFYGRAQPKAFAGRFSNSGPARPKYHPDKLPMCPPRWDGRGCWKHPYTNSHVAANCNSLRYLQRIYLAENGIDAKKAQQLHGYPPPSSLPAAKGTYNGGAQSRPQGTDNQLVVSQRRKRCALCPESGHITDACPNLPDAVKAYKRTKTTNFSTAAAAQAEASYESDSDAATLPAM